MPLMFQEKMASNLKFYTQKNKFWKRKARILTGLMVKLNPRQLCSKPREQVVWEKKIRKECL